MVKSNLSRDPFAREGVDSLYSVGFCFGKVDPVVWLASGKCKYLKCNMLY